LVLPRRRGLVQPIENVVRFAENLEPVALIGAGGIGKTSIVLTVLRHGRTKKIFG
jgi:ABC-type branched-subunit amino acid transport system ATPase component